MNYEEEKAKLDAEKNEKLNEYNSVYDQLIGDRNELMNQQNQMVEQYTQSQQQNLQNQLNYQQDLYNQKKEQADKEYQNEVKAGYADYQEYINPYGVERETQLQNGLSNTGYAESTKTNAYNTWQLRNAQARDTLKETQLQFDNAMKEAQLNHDASLAELAYQQLQSKLQNALDNFSYKDSATQNKINYQYTLDNDFYNRLQNVQTQINYEKEVAEQIRQWEAQMAYQKEQATRAQQQWEKEYALQQQQLEYQKQQDKIANSQRWAQINATKSSSSAKKDSGLNYQLGETGNSFDPTKPTNWANHVGYEIWKWADGAYGKVDDKAKDQIAESMSRAYKAGTMTMTEIQYICNKYGI